MDDNKAGIFGMVILDHIKRDEAYKKKLISA